MKLNPSIYLNNAAIKVSEFFSLFKQKLTTHSKANHNACNIMKEIEDARNKWVSASMNFEFAEDSDTIDYYSYMIKAYQVKYNQLIKHAKQIGINLDNLKQK